MNLQTLYASKGQDDPLNLSFRLPPSRPLCFHGSGEGYKTLLRTKQPFRAPPPRGRCGTQYWEVKEQSLSHGQSCGYLLRLVPEKPSSSPPGFTHSWSPEWCGSQSSSYPCV